MGLLEQAGIRVPKFRVAETPDQAYQIASGHNLFYNLILIINNIFLFIQSLVVIL